MILQDKVPLLSHEAIHHLHIFIFVLAIVHVTFCVLTILFGGMKVYMLGSLLMLFVWVITIWKIFLKLFWDLELLMQIRQWKQWEDSAGSEGSPARGILCFLGYK